MYQYSVFSRANWEDPIPARTEREHPHVGKDAIALIRLMSIRLRMHWGPRCMRSNRRLHKFALWGLGLVPQVWAQHALALGEASPFCFWWSFGGTFPGTVWCYLDDAHNKTVPQRAKIKSFRRRFLVPINQWACVFEAWIHTSPPQTKNNNIQRWHTYLYPKNWFKGGGTLRWGIP